MERDERTGLYLPGTAEYATTEDKPAARPVAKTEGGVDLPPELVEKAGRSLAEAKSYREALRVYKDSLAFDADTREAARLLLLKLNEQSAARRVAGAAKRKAKKATRSRVKSARKGNR